MDGSPQAARLTMVRSLFPGMVVCPTYNGGSLPSSLKRCCWAWRFGLVSEKPGSSRKCSSATVRYANARRRQSCAIAEAIAGAVLR
jgi:hypothetical protein